MHGSKTPQFLPNDTCLPTITSTQNCKRVEVGVRRFTICTADFLLCLITYIGHKVDMQSGFCERSHLEYDERSYLAERTRVAEMT